MATDKKTVTVEALQAHSYNGKTYAVGDTYEIDEQLVESVATQGKAVRADRVAHAKQQAADAEKARTQASHPVEPMTTEQSGLAPAKPKK
jgi:hypothetical protein